MALVQDPQNIRLAMLGMVDGNGHPYSWSAIINGRYNPEAMADCGYPVIPQYLGAQPKDALGIDGVEVTHVWCDDPSDAEKVARAACIREIVRRPEDVIGQVDAVVIATDIGHEHVDRARPFLEAGVPLFIDKPLCDNAQDLGQFVRWNEQYKAFLSTSALRYDTDFRLLRQQVPKVIGEMRLITMTAPKSWEHYGIHALEGVYPLLRPGGWQWAVHSGDDQSNVVHFRHEDRVDVVIAVIDDMYGGFACLNVYGTKGRLAAAHQDTFHAFKAQLEAFVDYLRTGIRPVPFEQTRELITLLVAGIRSREEAGQRVLLEDIRY